MATLQIAMETPSGRSLSLKFSIATAITIVGDIVDGEFLFGVHAWHTIFGATSRRERGQEGECSTRPGQEEGGERKALCKRRDTGTTREEKGEGREVRRDSISNETGARWFLNDLQ